MLGFVPHPNLRADCDPQWQEYVGYEQLYDFEQARAPSCWGTWYLSVVMAFAVPLSYPGPPA